MKIYTRKGDSGATSLFGGKSVTKDNIRIDAYGSVDELNSLVGLVISKTEIDQGKIVEKLQRVQSELLVLGSDLSTPLDVKVKIPRLTASYVVRLEKEIDVWQKKLPELKNFILPGGSELGSLLHVARTVTRRAERLISKLAGSEKINKNAQTYINRLSDWFFVLARFVNKIEHNNETIWIGRKTKR